MALTLIKEDGSGVAGANTYASLADGNAYAEARLYVDEWNAATDAQKNAALVMATRMIDSEIQFGGYKVDQLQALQWPRRLCVDPDSDQISAFPSSGMSGPYLPEDAVPKAVVDATCELAIQLLKSDRTGDAQGEGIKRVDLAGAIEVEFQPGTAPLALTRDVINLLSKYGRAVGAMSGVVKLQRA